MEMEEQARIETAKQNEAAKKEVRSFVFESHHCLFIHFSFLQAHRRALESKLPPEPEDGVDGLTKIRIRVQQNQFLERRFLKADTLQVCIDSLHFRTFQIIFLILPWFSGIIGFSSCKRIRYSWL